MVFSVMGLDPVPVMIPAILPGGTFMGITALDFKFTREIVACDLRSALAWMTSAFGPGQVIRPARAGNVFDFTGSFVLSSLGAAGALGFAVFVVMTLGMGDKPYKVHRDSSVDG